MRVQAKALAILLLVACSEPDEGSPTEAATAYLKATYGDAGDWSLSSVVPVPETKTETEVVAIVAVIKGGQEFSAPFSFTRASGRWEVRHDLNKLLNESIVDSPTAIQGMKQRCAQRLHERYGKMLDITVDLEVSPQGAQIEIRGSDILATVQSDSFVYKTLPGKPTGYFVDAYSYQDGEWRLQGAGTLFDGE